MRISISHRHFFFPFFFFLTSLKCLITLLFIEHKPLLAQSTFWMLLSWQVSFIILVSKKKKKKLRKSTWSVSEPYLSQRTNWITWWRKTQRGWLKLCKQTYMTGPFPSLRVCTFILNPERFSVAFSTVFCFFTIKQNQDGSHSESDTDTLTINSYMINNRGEWVWITGLCPFVTV